MFTIEESKRTKGFKPVQGNMETIENVRKERFDQNLALSGFNGKNIALTSNFAERTFKSKDGAARSYIALEVIYFKDKPENGKIGTLSLSSLKASIKPSMTENLQSVVSDFSEMSEREALNLLLEDGVYLKCEEELTVLKPIFNTNNGETKVDYSPEKTKKGYRYSVARLESKQG